MPKTKQPPQAASPRRSGRKRAGGSSGAGSSAKTGASPAKAGASPSAPKKMHVKIGQTVKLVLPGQDTVVGTAVIADNPAGSGPPQVLHGHRIADLQKEFGRPGEKYIVVKQAEIDAKFSDKPFPFGMKGADVPDTLSDVYPQGRYVWDEGSVRPMETQVSGADTASAQVEVEEVDAGKDKGGTEDKKATVPEKEEVNDEDEEDDVEDNTAKVPEKEEGEDNGGGEETEGPLKEKGKGGAVETVVVPPNNDDDDDVRSIGPEEFGGDDLSQIPDSLDKEDYSAEELRVRVDQLIPFRSQVRSISQKHVLDLEQSFNDHGNNYSFGMVMACTTAEGAPTHVAPTFPEELWEGINLGEDSMVMEDDERGATLKAVTVVNGLHRKTSLMRICTHWASQEPSEARTAAMKEYGWLRVRLVRRVDGRPLSGLEMIILGGSANEGSSQIRKPTFSDQLHLCMAFLKEVQRSLPNKDVRAGNFAKKIVALRLLGSMSEATVLKYARVAITFSKEEALYDKFYALSESDGDEKEGLLKIGHFQSAKFHNMFAHDEQLILLECLHAYQTQASLSRTGNFSSPADSAFFQECRDIMDGLHDISVKKGWTMQQVWDADVSVQRGKKAAVPCSCLKWFIRSMARFNTSGNRKDLEKRRVHRVRKFLSDVRKAIYPDLAPKSVASPIKKRETQKRDAKTAALDKTRGQQRNESKMPRGLYGRGGSGSTRGSRRGSTRASATTGRTKAGASHLQTGTCLQCNEEEVTVLTAAEGGEEHMTSWLKKASKKRYEFDDDVPADFPVGYGRSDKEWEGDKDWVNLITVPPHRLWGGENRVKHVDPWLRGMGVQDGHRSFVCLTPADLERNHHAVYLHAARLGAEESVFSRNPAYNGSDPKADPSKESFEDRANRVGLENPEVGEWFLAQKKKELEEVGYCVLTGLFDDSKISPGPNHTVYSKDFVSPFFSFYSKTDPSQALNKNPEEDSE